MNATFASPRRLEMPRAPKAPAGFAKPMPSKSLAAIRSGLRGDLQRCRQALYAYALFSERAGRAGNIDQEIALAARGEQQFLHNVVLEHLQERFGDLGDSSFDEESAVDNADEAAGPEWTFDTVARLRRRAVQCDIAGDPTAALQLRSLADAEEESPDLFLLLDETPEGNKCGQGVTCC